MSWALSGVEAADVILNEYNAVSPTGLLKNDHSDTFWGRVAGNGGDWFELVVITDHLDMRGWRLTISDDTGSAGESIQTLDLTSDAIWSDLRAGTIITVAEELADDVGYAPESGDWWINVQASATAAGTYITAQDFTASNNNWQLTIKDASDTSRFGPAGEGIEPPSGVGADEVCKLEEDPGPAITETSNYNDGTSSSFGSPNIFSAGSLVQDFTDLRPCVTDVACDDGQFCNGGERCVGGSCQAGANPCSAGQTCNEATDVCQAADGLPTECTIAADCDDGAFCNGAERCASENCEPGSFPCAADEFCDEEGDRCVNCLDDADCDDGLWCNGAETCGTAGLCEAGTAPCDDVDLCDELRDRCVQCLDHAACDDGLFCNGSELCDVTGFCATSESPCGQDEFCDEAARQCNACGRDEDCDDGVFCNGAESCTGGTCVAGDVPCAEGQVCDEDSAACLPDPNDQANGNDNGDGNTNGNDNGTDGPPTTSGRSGGLCGSGAAAFILLSAGLMALRPLRPHPSV